MQATPQTFEGTAVQILGTKVWDKKLTGHGKKKKRDILHLMQWTNTTVSTVTWVDFSQYLQNLHNRRHNLGLIS